MHRVMMQPHPFDEPAERMKFRDGSLAQA